MEQDVTATMPVMDSGVQNNGKGWKIATVIASVVAVCGIGFGIYGIVQGSQKDSQIANLKVQIEQKDEALAAIETPEIDITNNCETTAPIADASEVGSGPYIKNGVFYVPEWGLKFNIPSDLVNYGYSVDYDEAHVGYTQPSIGFTAMLESDITDGAQAAYYDNIETCAIVNVSKEDADWNSWGINGIVKDFENYKLLIWNYTRHGSCDYNLHIDEVQEKIQTMFSNPETL